MIRIIQSFDACRDFVCGFYGDPDFSDPMLTNEEQLQNNLIASIEKPDKHCVWGVFQNEQLVGLFAFLVLPDEKYMQMLVGLSRDKAAYQEMLNHLAQNYPSYDADFVFNPGNNLLKEQLEARGAEFEPEQQKMVLGTPVLGMNTAGVELLSGKYIPQYLAIHSKDMYWTGEKVVTAPDRFRTFLAIHEGKVIGYLDVTHCFAENEPYDLFVLEDYRKMGYGRKMLAKALEMNHPSGMMLLVDVDKDPAIRLFESMGFIKAEHQNTLTAHWNVPEQN